MIVRTTPISTDPTECNTLYLTRPEGRLATTSAGAALWSCSCRGWATCVPRIAFSLPRCAKPATASPEPTCAGTATATSRSPPTAMPKPPATSSRWSRNSADPPSWSATRWAPERQCWRAALHPGLISGLVLVGPFVRNGKMSALQRVMLRVAMAPPWAASAWKSYMPKLYAGQRPADFAEYRDQVVASLRRPGYAKAFSRTARTNHDPAEARLADVVAPTLVLMGELDPDFPDPRGEAEWIAQALHGEVVMVPEAGHYPQSQQPDITTSAVLSASWPGGMAVPRAGLTEARVVDEAERIADEVGLARLTLAAIADRLGVRQPSLYKHIDGHGRATARPLDTRKERVGLGARPRRGRPRARRRRHVPSHTPTADGHTSTRDATPRRSARRRTETRTISTQAGPS